MKDLFEAHTIAALAARLDEPYRRMEALLAELEGLPDEPAPSSSLRAPEALRHNRDEPARPRAPSRLVESG